MGKVPTLESAFGKALTPEQRAFVEFAAGELWQRVERVALASGLDRHEAHQIGGHVARNLVAQVSEKVASARALRQFAGPH